MSAVQSADFYFDRLEGYLSSQFKELGAGPMPIEPYVSPEYFELEREKIFKKMWFRIGHEADLPNPGDYFVKEVPFLNATFIIVRGQDGIIRGFHNVCTHRGNRLEYECGSGRKRLFVCKFHSWSFDTQGKLKVVTEQDRFIGLDKESRNLRPVAVSCWKGYIFMNAEPEPATSLDEYLGSLKGHLDRYPFEKLRLGGFWSATVKANWKTLADAFQEGYHVTTVHRQTVPSIYKTSRSGQHRIRHFETHGPHRSFTAPRNPLHIPTPMEALGYGLAMPSLDYGADGKLWPGTNVGGEPVEAFGFDVNVVFPTMFIDTSQGFTFTYDMYPVAVDETRYEARLYLNRPKTWSERIGQEFLINQLRENLLEDMNQIENVQAGLASGALKDIVLSDQEIAIRHNLRVVESLVRG